MDGGKGGGGGDWDLCPQSPKQGGFSACNKIIDEAIKGVSRQDHVK